MQETLNKIKEIIDKTYGRIKYYCLRYRLCNGKQLSFSKN
jgi:hypothetical protein